MSSIIYIYWNITFEMLYSGRLRSVSPGGLVVESPFFV
jgi:hypothetical protein